MFVSLCVNYPVYLVLSLILSGLLVTPRCFLCQPCLVLLCPDVFIKDYYLSLSPRRHVPVPCSMPADRGRYPPLAVALPSPPAGSRVAAPLGAPFAGDHATGSPLTQCPPARLWLNARRIAADSSPPDRRWLMPAGSPLTHARRIATDSSLPDRRWLMPSGRRYP